MEPACPVRDESGGNARRVRECGGPPCTLHASCAGVPQVSNLLYRRFPNRLAERIGGEPDIQLARRLGNLRYRRLGSRRYRLGRLAGPNPLSNCSHIKDPCKVQNLLPHAKRALRIVRKGELPLMGANRQGSVPEPWPPQGNVPACALNVTPQVPLPAVIGFLPLPSGYPFRVLRVFRGFPIPRLPRRATRLEN